MTIDNVTAGEKIQADWGNSVADQVNALTDQINALLAEGTYVPSLVTTSTSPTFSGTPSISGRYRTIGLRIEGTYYLNGTLNNNPSGTFHISLPVPAANDSAASQVGANVGGSGTAIGVWAARDVTDGIAETGVMGLRNSTTAWLLQADGTGLTATELGVTSGENIVITGSFLYWAAPA